MKTTLFPLLIALMCGSLLAEPIDVNGRFQSKTPGGFPDGWVMHEWGGYKPFPTVKTIPGACEGNTALSITNVLGDDGGAIQTRAKFPARSGSVGRISFLAKGKGLAWATFYRWGEKGALERGHRQFSIHPLRHVAAARLDDSHRQRTCLRNACRHARHRRQDGRGDPGLQFDPRHPAAANRRRHPHAQILDDLRARRQGSQTVAGTAPIDSGNLRRSQSSRRPISSPTRWISRPWPVPARTNAHGRSLRIEAKYDCEMTVGAGAGWVDAVLSQRRAGFRYPRARQRRIACRDRQPRQERPAQSRGRTSSRSGSSRARPARF